MDKLTQKNTARGFSILEILLAMGIFTIVISGVIAASGGLSQNISGSQSSIVGSETNAEATQKAQELLEQSVAKAREDFESLPTGTTNGTSGIYSWTNDVALDALNPDIKKITSTVTWSLGSRTLSTKLYSLVGNPGGMKCSPSISGDWSNPVLLGTADVGQSNGATDVFVLSKKAYVTAHPSAVAKSDFYIFDVADPVGTLTSLGEINLGSGAEAVYVSGKYAYVANADATAQLVIIDISGASPVQVKSFKAPGVTAGGTETAEGNSIYVEGKKVYLGLTDTKTGPEFHVIDVSAFVSNGTSDPVYLGGYSVGSAVNKILIKDKTAFIATGGLSANLMKLDVTSPGSISQLQSYMPADDLKSKMDGLSVILSRDGQSVFLGRSEGFSSASDPEFYSLKASNIADVQASKYIGAEVNAVAVRNNLAFLITSDSSRELQIYDLGNLSGSAFGSLNLEATPTGGFDCVGNLLYVGQRSNDALQIIGPAPDYTLSNGGDITVEQGSGGNTTITRVLAGGYAPGVTLSASGLPAGATATFTNNPCAPTCASVLTINTTLATPEGDSVITVSGSPSGISTTPTTFNLHVTKQPFDYALSKPADVSLVRGGSSKTTSFTSTLSAGNTQAVSYSNSALPSGVTLNYSATSCSPNCTTTLTLSASAAATVGNSTITITGSPLGKTTTFNLAVTAPAFSYSLSNISNFTVVRGGASVSVPVTVTMASGAVPQQVTITPPNPVPSQITITPGTASCTPSASPPYTCQVTFSYKAVGGGASTNNNQQFTASPGGVTSNKFQIKVN